jgi:hypothetical protein
MAPRNRVAILEKQLADVKKQLAVAKTIKKGKKSSSNNSSTHRDEALKVKAAFSAAFKNIMINRGLGCFGCKNYSGVAPFMLTHVGNKKNTYNYNEKMVGNFKISLNELLDNIPLELAIDNNVISIDNFKNISVRIRDGNGERFSQVNINPDLLLTVNLNGNHKQVRLAHAMMRIK